MASIVDRVRSWFGTSKAAQTQAPYATTIRSQLVTSQTYLRRSSRLLRNFADRNEALRTAINWRKQQVSESKWRVVRVDNPKAPPKKSVVAEVTQLLTTVNTKRESLRSLLDQVIEDTLVLDAGCIEKEKTVGGKIMALWGVDGATIAPDPSWDGRQAKAIRYRQWLDGRLVAELRNDQMLYMMQNPSTHRVLGWSQVETLVNVIEAELYGERYDFDMLKNAAPPGILDLGRGLSDTQVVAFREYYHNEISGTPDIAIFGGGEPGQGAGINFSKFGFSPKDMDRASYKQWLINKIAFVMQIDKTVLGLVDDVNRSTSKTMSTRTDQGFIALANLIAEYITRELVWEIDENHGFEFTDLVTRDPIQQAKIDQIYMQIGVTFPNEIRAREGEDPVEWGDIPWPDTITAQTEDPADPEPEAEPAQSPGKDDAKAGKAVRLSAIDRAATHERLAAQRYRASATIANLENWEAAIEAHCELREAAKRPVPFGAKRSAIAKPKLGYLSSSAPSTIESVAG